MDFDEILAWITGKGDFGMAALGFVLGYLLDLKFPLAGLAPRIAAALGAILAIGLKNTVQAGWDQIRVGREERSEATHRQQELERAATEIEKLTLPEDQLLASSLSRLRSDRELWRKHLISDQEFKGTIANFVDRYRRVAEHPPLPARVPEEEPLRAITLGE